MDSYSNMDIDYSIVIHFVSKTFTKRDIDTVFKKIDLGHIRDIEMYPNQEDNEEGWKVIIHYDTWNESVIGEVARGRLNKGEILKIVYNKPLYWKISKLKPLESSLKPIECDLNPIECHLKSFDCDPYIEFTYYEVET